MINQLSYKTKQFFFVLIKISIVVIAFYFIYQKITQNSSFEFDHFWSFLIKNELFSLKNIVFLIILSVFNWFFEILKWQKLVSSTIKISLKNALEQTLGSLTASLFTPNRIGEYGAKAIYFTKTYRKRILLINLISNLFQMGITTILGIVGFSFLVLKFDVDLNYIKLIEYIVIFTLLFIFIIYIFIKSEHTIKGFSIKKIKTFILNYPKNIIVYGFCFSLLRYLIFSFQFYYLITLFGLNIPYLNAMMLITSMYLLASIIPSIFIFDVVIKGSVAVYLFSFVGINAFTILSIVSIMWLLNFVIPSIFGSYFVLKFKFPKPNS